MNLLNLKYREDFGHEWYVQILNTGRHFPKPLKNRSLIQVSVSWNDFPGWPYCQITFGSNGFLGVLLWVYKFGFDVDILSRTWNWDYMREEDGEETELV